MFKVFFFIEVDIEPKNKSINSIGYDWAEHKRTLIFLIHCVLLSFFNEMIAIGSIDSRGGDRAVQWCKEHRFEDFHKNLVEIDFFDKWTRFE